MLKYILATFTAIAFTSFSYAENKVETHSDAKKEIDTANIPKISEAFGHLIGKNLESLGFQFDVAQVVKGIQDSMAGKQSPMSENDCVQAISHIQESLFQKLAKDNLEKAKEFMVTNKRNEGVVEIEKDKLQYKITKSGTGAEVEAHFSPIIRYTGKFIDGKVFGASKEDEMISLDETIPGFSKGIIGMKEGETRTIFIHPDMGYGTSGYLPPNSSLIFDVELIKANAPQQQQESLISNLQSKNSDEIAEAADEMQAIR